MIISDTNMFVSSDNIMKKKYKKMKLFCGSFLFKIIELIVKAIVTL